MVNIEKQIEELRAIYAYNTFQYAVCATAADTLTKLKAVYESARLVADEVIPHKPEGDIAIIDLRNAIAEAEKD